MKDRAAVIAVVALVLAWGYSWIVIKIATGYASPFVLVAIRMMLGSATLFAMSAVMCKRLKSPPPGPTALIGLLQVGLMTTFQVLALTTGGAGKTALLIYTFPFWIALLSLVFLHERFTRVTTTAVIVAAVGLAFVLYPLDLGSDVISKMFALISAFCWALGALVTKRFRAKHDVELVPFTAWQMAYGAIPIVILALFVPGGYVRVTPEFLAVMAYIVILGTALAFWLWFFILERLSATGAGIASLLTPVISVLAAWIQLHEQPGTPELIGMALIVIALLINSGVLQFRTKVSPPHVIPSVVEGQP